jgi:hypothetical protein
MISVSFETIVPESFKDGVIRVYLLNEARKIITQIKKDFARTVKTWETKPKFEPDLGFTLTTLRVGVFTEDENYVRVSEGTKGVPRVARGAGLAVDGKPKALTIVPYITKSPPGQLDAQKGGAEEGPIILRKYALNAGKIKPRKFDELVYDEWKDKMADLFQAALDAAALKTGYAI